MGQESTFLAFTISGSFRLREQAVPLRVAVTVHQALSKTAPFQPPF